MDGTHHISLAVTHTKHDGGGLNALTADGQVFPIAVKNFLRPLPRGAAAGPCPARLAELTPLLSAAEAAALLGAELATGGKVVQATLVIACGGNHCDGI